MKSTWLASPNMIASTTITVIIPCTEANWWYSEGCPIFWDAVALFCRL